jgi:hypothetical protein
MKTQPRLAFDVLVPILRLWYNLKLEEIRVRIVNWLLLSGWLLLISSMLFPYGPWYFFEVRLCGVLPGCENHPHHLGNMMFWGATIPLILLLILLSGHTVWRRICPLAFVAQVTRHLDWQRRRRRPDGVLDIPRIDPNSFLGRHHVRLQWFLLIVGLSLRLLTINSNPISLALTLLATLLAAALVGWLWGGKAWCQYFCPMGPVEAILIGAALDQSLPVAEAKKALPQSICRTVVNGDRVRSACVHCQSPCIDIDAERSYWYGQISNKGFNLAWWSYPGLVLSFFFILQSLEPGDALYMSRAHWATDTQLDSHIQSPFHLIPHLLHAPRFVAIPSLLALGAVGAILGFYILHKLCKVSLHRTRLLATYLALNIFFVFADPSLGAGGAIPTASIRLLVFLFSTRSLLRGWNHDRNVYLYAKALSSLHRHARRYLPELTTIKPRSTWSQDRQIASLMAMVSLIGQQTSQELRQSLYRAVLHDISKEVLLDRSEIFSILEPLRVGLGIESSESLTMTANTIKA